MELDLYRMEVMEGHEKAFENYKKNLSRISAGRANPKVLDSVNVIYYEAPTPINQIASISVPEPRQLLIKPFDQSVNKDIASAINSASLGLNAVDEGHQVRINFPELTTDRRRDLVKSLANFTEQAKVQVRHARQETNKQIKGDDELSEDMERSYLETIQKMTDKAITEIDAMTKEKEKDLMTM